MSRAYMFVSKTATVVHCYFMCPRFKPGTGRHDPPQRATLHQRATLPKCQWCDRAERKAP
jgi:hypothetical protein